MIGGLIKENKIKEGLKSILTELERIKQNGFINKELELYKKKTGLGGGVVKMNSCY